MCTVPPIFDVEFILGTLTPNTNQPKCNLFADRYLETDFIIIFIDMVLQKRTVYRHLLWNKLQYDANELNVNNAAAFLFYPSYPHS